MTNTDLIKSTLIELINNADEEVLYEICIMLTISKIRGYSLNDKSLCKKCREKYGACSLMTDDNFTEDLCKKRFLDYCKEEIPN